MNRTMKNKKGFTLMEMLIVVAVIAILVAVAIPVYNAQMHKAGVAADWANVRAYYAEIQADYLMSGKYSKDVPDVYAGAGSGNQQYGSPGVGRFDVFTLPFLNGDIELKAGSYMVTHNSNENGYEILYNCEKGCAEHTLHLNPSPVVSGG